jgi:hypothetical protein
MTSTPGTVAYMIWIVGIIGAVVGAIMIHPALIVLAIAPAYVIVIRARRA